jgi:hypothetical protein
MPPDHRGVAEVPILAQARVLPTEVVERDSKADWPPSRDAVLVAASAEARRLAERTDRSVEGAVSLNEEPANLDVTTDNDRTRLLRRP